MIGRLLRPPASFETLQALPTPVFPAKVGIQSALPSVTFPYHAISGFPPSRERRGWDNNIQALWKDRAGLRYGAPACRLDGMTPDVTAIIAVGVALGGLMVAMFQATNRRLDSMERRLDSVERRIDSMDQRTSQRLDSFEGRLSELEQWQARLEGLMEAIRDILSRAPSAQ